MSDGAPLRVGAVVHMEEVEKLLSDLALKVHDLRPAFRRIDSNLTALLREQFDTRGKRLGTPWKPISPVTVAIRTNRRMASKAARRKAIAAKGAGTVLRDTNRLWASYTKPQGPDALRVIDRLRYERGTLVPYARHHQVDQKQTRVFGKPRKQPVTVPARPVIPSDMPAPVLKTWEGYLVQYITAGEVG